jgi:hypothetical protein
MRNRSGVSALAAFGLMAATRRRLRWCRRLKSFPLFNRGTIEAPVATDAKTGKPALTEQPVNRGRMNAKMFRQLLDSENFFVRGSHRSRRPLRGELQPFSRLHTVSLQPPRVKAK